MKSNSFLKTDDDDDDERNQRNLTSAAGRPTVEGSSPLFRAAVMAPLQPELQHMPKLSSAKGPPPFSAHLASSGMPVAYMVYSSADYDAIPQHPEQQLQYEPFVRKEPLVRKELLELPSPGWNKDAVRVNALPMYYQLEKHHVSFPKAKLQAVLNGLQDIFRTDSLKVDYKDGCSTETAAAYCESMEGVQFVVQIWENDASFHVAEVQRIAGDGMLFCMHGYAKRVLGAVKEASEPSAEYVAEAVTDPLGAVKEASEPSAEYVAEVVTDPLAFSMDTVKERERLFESLVKGLDFVAPNKDNKEPLKYVEVSPSTDFAAHRASEDDVASAISIVEDLLSSKLCDRVALGLSSLLAMTDPNSSGYTTALSVARTVLLGATGMSDSILFLALTGRWPPSVKMYENDAWLQNEMGREHAFAALTILAQAVNLMDDASMAEFVEKVSARDLSLVDPLLQSVYKAGASPHFAYLATHILACLCRAIPDIRAQVRCHHLPTVQFAQHVGTCSHAALAQASHRLLQELRANI